VSQIVEDFGERQLLRPKMRGKLRCLLPASYDDRNSDPVVGRFAELALPRARALNRLRTQEVGRGGWDAIEVC
jgi:hypothetical protein